MEDTQVTALIDAVDDTSTDGTTDSDQESISFDGLVVATTESGYRFETPKATADALSESELRETAEQHEAYVTNWYFWHHVVDTTDDARRAFLRRCENAEEHPVPERYDALADGIETAWGELLLTVSLSEGGRRQYEIRNEADADIAPGQLDTHTDPLDARELVKHDDNGRYRPLKTAPSLPTGWRFGPFGPDDFVRTVDLIYPATVANWHREHSGNLDVTHYRECAERQTGIYDMIEGLDAEAVDWVAQACCADSQCVKRREWEYDEDHELEADGGSGAFPCREPCSLVVAAARKWTTLESETPRTYEFELTPSEKNQLEELIDAVADDRTDDIREADVYEGANRYRTRYLRAKLFDEDGNLCGVPTTDD